MKSRQESPWWTSTHAGKEGSEEQGHVRCSRLWRTLTYRGNARYDARVELSLKKRFEFLVQRTHVSQQMVSWRQKVQNTGESNMKGGSKLLYESVVFSRKVKRRAWKWRFSSSKWELVVI